MAGWRLPPALALPPSLSLCGISAHVVSIVSPPLGRMREIWEEGVRRTGLGGGPARIWSAAPQPDVIPPHTRLTGSVCSDHRGDWVRQGRQGCALRPAHTERCLSGDKCLVEAELHTVMSQARQPPDLIIGLEGIERPRGRYGSAHWAEECGAAWPSSRKLQGRRDLGNSPRQWPSLGDPAGEAAG